MTKSIKNVTLEDLEEMGIDIKAILQDKLKKKKRRKSKKTLKKIDDKSFFPKPYQPFNNSFGGGGFMGPPMLTAKIDPNVSINAVKEVENSLSSKITDVTNRFDTQKNVYNNDKRKLGQFLQNNFEAVNYLYDKSKNNTYKNNKSKNNKYEIYKPENNKQKPINFNEYPELENNSRFGNPKIDYLLSTRFNEIENNSANNNFIKVQTSNFYRDEIPEPDYFNPSDDVGGLNEKEMEFESNYEDEAMKQEELNTDNQQYQTEPIDENNNEDIVDNVDIEDNEDLMDTSQVDAEYIKKETEMLNMKYIRQLLNGNKNIEISNEQLSIMQNILSTNNTPEYVTSNQFKKLQKYLSNINNVYVEDVEDDENIEDIPVTTPKKVKKSTTLKLKDQVMKNKNAENFKPKKL